MSVKKQLFVATSRYERVTIRRSSLRQQINLLCKACGKHVEWLTLAEVAAITGQDTDAIRLKIASGELDFQITDDNRFLICSASVLGGYEKI